MPAGEWLLLPFTVDDCDVPAPARGGGAARLPRALPRVRVLLSRADGRFTTPRRKANADYIVASAAWKVLQLVVVPLLAWAGGVMLIAVAFFPVAGLAVTYAPKGPGGSLGDRADEQDRFVDCQSELPHVAWLLLLYFNVAFPAGRRSTSCTRRSTSTSTTAASAATTTAYSSASLDV